MKKIYTSFDEKDLKDFEPDAKVGIIATVNPAGQPRLTLITTLQAASPTRLIFGQFTEGRSKEQVKTNPKVGFAIMTRERSLWRGMAIWTHTMEHGEEYETFNKKPMFRYNAYFGIHTVHYLDLKQTYGREALPLVRILIATLVTRAARPAAATGRTERILKPWAEDLFKRIDTIKFLSYLKEDGFPVIIPLMGCQAADSRRLVFAPLAYADELAELREGTTVAVFGLTMQMENVLVRGLFAGFSRYRGITLGCVELNWVYNSMPPVPCQVYPEEELRPVMNY